MNIRHLLRSEIDTAKWNRCVHEAANGLVYHYSHYLDALCTRWDALVLDDYAAIMPLPWRQKWGIRYVYTPPFVQQLGVVGKTDAAVMQAFVSHMHRYCRYGDYHFNFQNHIPGAAPRINYVLPLQQSYNQIESSYHPHLRRNLQRAAARGLVYEPSENYQQAIAIFCNLFNGNLPGTHAKDFKNVARFCSQHPEHWSVRLVKSENKETLATALLLQAKGRHYLLMPAVLPEGRKLSAGHFLIDCFIREKAGGAFLLDFEGSDLPGVQRFYASFGGVNEPYSFFHWNRLPAPVRWIKK